MNYSGPMADPERQVDLNPLLDLLRSRFLQRQLDRLEVLEEERRRADAEAAAEESQGDRRGREHSFDRKPEAPADALTLRRRSRHAAAIRTCCVGDDGRRMRRGAAPADTSAGIRIRLGRTRPRPRKPWRRSSRPEPAPPKRRPLRRLPLRAAPRQARAPAAAAPAPQPPTVLLPPQPEFKTLPNGVVVKVR